MSRDAASLRTAPDIARCLWIKSFIFLFGCIAVESCERRKENKEGDSMSMKTLDLTDEKLRANEFGWLVQLAKEENFEVRL